MNDIVSLYLRADPAYGPRPLSHFRNRLMRAEVLTMVDEIQQSLALLRRYL
jgi:hypothetical protein